MSKKGIQMKVKAPKRERNKKSQEINPQDEVKSFLYTFLGVIVFMGIVYLCILGMKHLGVFEKGYTEPVKEETVINYEFIPMGTILNRNEKSYYVLFDNFKNSLTEDVYINGLLSEQKMYRVYKVDMSLKENEKYLSKEPNAKAQTISDLKINGITLIKVSDGKIVKYLTGSDEIENFLK